MHKNIDKEVLKYLSKRKQGAILQNMIDDLEYHRFTIQKALYRLMIDDKIKEVIYSHNVKVYWKK